MAKKIEGFECDKCHSFYNGEGSALACEAAHPTKESVSIANMSFSPIDDSYGWDRGYRQRYPKSVRIKFSENSGDFATYVLEHVGFKGV